MKERDRDKGRGSEERRGKREGKEKGRVGEVQREKATEEGTKKR